MRRVKRGRGLKIPAFVGDGGRDVWAVVRLSGGNREPRVGLVDGGSSELLFSVVSIRFNVVKVLT